MKHATLKDHQAQDKKQLARMVIGAFEKMHENPNCSQAK